MIPQRIAGRARAAAERNAMEILERLGLEERFTHRPPQLSGGEQQRVALARALANRPRILLADEPTGNLDSRTAGSVFESLVELVRSDGLAALIATHNLELAARMDRSLMLHEGKLLDAGKLAAGPPK